MSLPEGHVIAPEVRGYALMGAGRYLLNCACTDGVPELVISIATDDDKAGRSVGDVQDNPDGKVIHPEEIAVRIGFFSERGLFALEQQLRLLRAEYFLSPAALVWTPRKDEG